MEKAGKLPRRVRRVSFTSVSLPTRPETHENPDRCYHGSYSSSPPRPVQVVGIDYWAVS